tara:strand:+ start:41121 stop:42059 length:939 start_codon:yes stop_codon:yes gene_type:complete
MNSNNKPFFSVVIPLYNKEDYIEDTLKSVLNQTFQDFEIIIVNDGSTDRSLETVKSFSDKKIIILNQENRGLSASRNIGIKTSKSKFIAFLDADDLWMENFLETIYWLINKHSDYYIFATNVKFLTPQKKPDLIVTKLDTNYKSIITNYFKPPNCVLNFSSFVTNKTVFEKVGYFNETINYGEEDDFYIRCFNTYHLIYYNDFKAYYRIGLKDQLTTPNKNFKRKIPDYDSYLKNNKNPDLKKYIDHVHYKLVVLFKMEKNYKLVKLYKSKINPSNLSLLKKIKFYLPTTGFYFIKSIYLYLKQRLNLLIQH